jgi:hypothetical protein
MPMDDEYIIKIANYGSLPLHPRWCANVVGDHHPSNGERIFLAKWRAFFASACFLDHFKAISAFDIHIYIL